MNPLIPGFGFIMIAAVAGGAFSLPLRMRKRFAVENTVLLAMGMATIVIPTIVVSLIFPNWPMAISAAGLQTVLIVFLFGFGWGCGAVTFALGVNNLGLALGFAVIMGLSTVVGSVVPMIRNLSSIPSTSIPYIIMGILVCIAAVAALGRAGGIRDKAAVKDESAMKAGSFALGLFFCVLSGLLSACANLGYEWAGTIGDSAADMGVDPRFATIPRWMPMYWGGYLAILVFLGSTMVKSKTVGNYRGPGAARDFWLAVMMGVLHFLAQIPYGVGAYYLDLNAAGDAVATKMGTTIGWVMNIASSIIVAQILGSLAGEWRKSPRAAATWRFAGVFLLIAAMAILAYSKTL
ncbi:MAG: hypothetical protein HYX78_09015 [Armatimonadetes bacterium]|nr:hypothetical protein [Armatimonadota bacterium]